MRTGVNITPREWHRFSDYPHATLCRVFGTVNAPIPIPPWSTLLHRLPHTVTPHVSFKDWPSDAFVRQAVNAHLREIPVSRQEWLTYHHEPESDVAPKTYKRRWRFLADVVEDHPARKRVTLVPIQTLYWTVTKGKGNGDAWTYTAGVGDFYGMDCYANSWEDRYPDPAVLFAPAVRAAGAAGLPLVLPELGAIKMPHDRSGAGRAAWIGDCCAWLDAKGCVAVSWWDAIGTGGRDFRLDPAAKRAWSAVLASGER